MAKKKANAADKKLVETDSLGVNELGNAMEKEAAQRKKERASEARIVETAVKGKSLGDILLEADLLSAEQLGIALELKLKEGKQLRDVLKEQDMITPEQLATALSIQLNMPLIDLKRHTIQPIALRKIPEELARKYTVIPLDIIEQVLLVVMSDPTDIYAIEDLQAQAKMSIEPLLGIPSQIEQAINLHYSATDAIQRQMKQFAPYELAETEGGVDLETIARSPIAQTFDLIVTQAIKDRASDIHIEPQEGRVRIRYRIDGILHETANLPSSALSALVTRIKVLAGLDIAEQRRPQDGQFSVTTGGNTVDIRVASIGTSEGERVTLRILEKERTFIPMGELGLSQAGQEIYQEMLNSAYGMILISGPTGSGKTTTLYASIDKLDRNSLNVMTVEDPIEYSFNNITQVQVNLRAGITFSTGLRSFIRHDPDIIMVGEIRDKDTVDIAGHAALTGHLVLSSVHANDSISTLFRLMDLDMEPWLISATTVGVIAQRMVRRICQQCRTTFEPTAKERAAYEAIMGESSVTFHIGKGCKLCNNTGYLGRIGVFEVLELSEELRQMLVNGISAGEMKSQALKEGLITMQRDGMQKVKEGITTPAEVLRTVFAVGQR